MWDAGDAWPEAVEVPRDVRELSEISRTEALGQLCWRARRPVPDNQRLCLGGIGALDGDFWIRDGPLPWDALLQRLTYLQTIIYSVSTSCICSIF